MQASYGPSFVSLDEVFDTLVLQKVGEKGEMLKGKDEVWQEILEIRVS